MPRQIYEAPGVYVEEISRGSRPIEGVSMSVAGFVGFTEDIRGDAEPFQPMLITTWSQYLDFFSKPGSDGYTDFGAYLPFAVKGWFDNGGGRCWVVSIGTQKPRKNNEEATEDSNAITEVLTSGKRPSLKFKLKRNEQNRNEQNNRRLRLDIRADEPRPQENTEEEFDTGEFFQITITRGREKPYIFRHLSMNPGVLETEGQYVLMAHAEVKRSSEQGVAITELLDIEVVAEGEFALAKRPAFGAYEVIPPREPYPENKLYPIVYGSQKNRTGMQGLFEKDEVAMIACPDLMLAYQEGWLNLSQVHAIMELMITGCENSAPSPPYRMAVLDAPPVKPNKGDNPVDPDQVSPQDVEKWLMESFGRRSQFAALYYPWIEVPNPRDNGNPIFVPPCGHMMGIWCQTDETRGVYKAPANVVPRGVTGLAYEVNFREQELLNPVGINCIRKFRDRGTLVWGARTLADPNNDIDWRYISVRRLMSYISKSIERGTQWAVFEPNDQDLWARVTRTVNNFLERLWREGALFGGTPEEAFYVKCDSELNTPETMRLGRLYVEIGVSPVRPAEFVIFRISQWNDKN